MKRSIELRVKIKTLTAEAHIIRHEERKLHGMERWDVQHHRKTVVRDAARRTLIAYQHIRGRDVLPHVGAPSDSPSVAGERFFRCLHDWPHVEKMITKYGDAEAVERLPELREIMTGYIERKPLAAVRP